MSAQQSGKHLDLIERFSLFEKLLMRVGFYGFIIVGACGIFLESTAWGLIYAGFVVLGLNFVVLYRFCSRCPYPFQYSDCLFIPAGLIKKKCKFRAEPMGTLDMIGSAVIMAGLGVIPQYWLLKNHVLLILFWIFCLPVLAALPLYFCRRCRHFKCPLNSARKEGV